METKTNPAKLESIRIEGAPALDPVTLFLEDFGDHMGRVTVVCYGECWTAFFGSMGCGTIREFVKTSPASYLADKLMPYPGKMKVKEFKTQESYVRRIVDAVQTALK